MNARPWLRAIRKLTGTGLTNPGKLALIEAIKDGDAGSVERYLRRGGDPDASVTEGHRLLHVAATAGKSDIVKLLIDAGANLGLGDKNGRTPLYCAIAAQTPGIARTLIEAGAPVDALTDDGCTLLHVTAIYDDVETAGLLLDRGIYIGARTTDSRLSALHMAASSGTADFVQLLMNRGCDPNMISGKGDTALHLAASRKDADMVRVLLAHGAIRQIRNANGKTAAMVAKGGAKGLLDALDAKKALDTEFIEEFDEGDDHYHRPGF